MLASSAMNHLATIIGTFAYCGFFPVAPATFASLVFALMYIAVPGGEVMAHPLVAASTLVVSVPVSSWLERRRGHDARCIVIDEIVGMQVVLVAASPTTAGVVLAFFLFRFFDIVKFFPAGRSQRLPRGYGVVADDVIAGLQARAVLMLLALLFPALGGFKV
jgi:phosphatidylglycerophosphatase A